MRARLHRSSGSAGLRLAARVAVIAAAVGALMGCVVYPYPYHPYRYPYYYYP
jgi:hypothetical protein